MRAGLIQRLDAWLGKTLFLPLIVRICQMLGWTQHRFSRVCWFASALVALYFAEAALLKVVMAVVALIMCVTAAMIPDWWPERSRMWFRVVVWLLATIAAIGPDWSICYDIIVLFAEYAATIRTIPPLQKRERKAKAYRAIA